MIEKEIACVICGDIVISKHFKVYMCDSCYLDHMGDNENSSIKS